MDARVKVVRIKAGVVRRVAKEAALYRREADQQRQKGRAAAEGGADPHQIKHNAQLLEEALMMVPDADRRLKKALHELKEILESEQDIKDTTDYKEATQIFENSTKQLLESEQAEA